MAPRSPPYQIHRYDVRILLPSLPMRQAGPWFLESSHRSQAEARYEALLVVAQTDRGAIELIQVAVNGPGARQDARSLQAWSYRPGQGAFGLRAWPMDRDCKALIEKMANRLVERAAADNVIVTYRYAPSANLGCRAYEAIALAYRKPWKPLAIAACLCLVFTAGLAVGHQTAHPVATASLVGITSPRWCFELGEDRQMVRLWTEHPQMPLEELAERRQLEGLKRLHGSDPTTVRKTANLMRLNFFDSIR